MSEIEIKQFIRDERGSKIGYVDFTVKYSEEKNETYRNYAVFVKDNKKWISDPKVRRTIKQEDGTSKEGWVSIYKRNPPLSKDIYSKVLTEIERDFL